MRRLILAGALVAFWVFIILLVADAGARTISYPAHGWLPPGALFEWEHPDQGRDFVTNWRGVIQAPGSGCVVGIGSDRPFPNGFGPSFVLVRIDTGAFASASPYYLGHTSAVARDGQCFKFGAPLARADQGHPSDICSLPDCGGYSVPVDGGWVELGQQEPSGALGPNNGDAGHWYDGLLRTSLVVVVSDPLDIFPKTVFSLPGGNRASEWGTVRAFEGFGCRNPVRRLICKTSRLHLQLLRDRDVWVAYHRNVNGRWEALHRPNWLRDHLGQRVHRIQFDLTTH